jgi:hypothetical protein
MYWRCIGDIIGAKIRRIFEPCKKKYKKRNMHRIIYPTYFILIIRQTSWALERASCEIIPIS